MVYVHKSLRVSSTEGYFYKLTRFIGITGKGSGLRCGVEILSRVIPRKFQHPLTSYNFSLRGYNEKVLWRFTATEEVTFLSTSLQGGSLTWRDLEKRFIVQTLH